MRTEIILFGFEVPTALALKSALFCDVMLCCLEVYRRVEGIPESKPNKNEQETGIKLSLTPKRRYITTAIRSIISQKIVPFELPSTYFLYWLYRLV
jgi:hypothetical protein